MGGRYRPGAASPRGPAAEGGLLVASRHERGLRRSGVPADAAPLRARPGRGRCDGRSASATARRSGWTTSCGRWLSHYHQVVRTSPTSACMTDAVRWIQDQLWVDRLEATIEAHTMAAAQVRETCSIPGTSVRTAWLCRDKPSMKEVLRAAGVPTAASAAASTADEVRAFAAAVGYPLILKPRTRCRRARHHAGRRRRRAGRGAGPVRRPAGRLHRRRGVRRGARGLLRHPLDRRRPGAGLRVPLLPERARGDADPLDLAAVPGHQPDRLGGRLPGAARHGAAGQRGARASAPAPRTWSGSSGRRA